MKEIISFFVSLGIFFMFWAVLTVIGFAVGWVVYYTYAFPYLLIFVFALLLLWFILCSRG